MGATFAEARDDISTLFKANWEAFAASSAIPIIWADVKAETPQTGSFARFIVQHTVGGQQTTGDQKKFRREGQVTVRIFTETGDGLKANDELSQIALNIFDGQTAGKGIWFSGVTANEEGIDGSRFVTTVDATFHYHERK